MTISPLDIKNSLDKAFRLLKPKRKDLDDFKRHFNTLISHINEQETEEHVKIHLMDFLKAQYHPEHFVATNGRTDFVIHTGANAQTPVAVMFEVKRPASKHEMISKTNLNAKAMHEIILYFLEERFDKKNISLTNLVITNIYEWFVFDATIFERIFTQNKQLENAYQQWKNGQKVSTSTGLFYDEIVKPFLKELDKEISFTYFDIRDYEKSLKRIDDKNDTKLIALYKFFTPTHLLKLSFANDSNSLDKGFFAELLHIIGLEEVKIGGKKLIDRPSVEKRNNGSIIENALNILDLEDVLRKVPSKLLFGETREEKLFNLALDLSITWVNRLLFLKLLEAQLLKYHQGDRKYRFLNVQTIKDYDELYKLFFQVLAKRNNDRLPAIQEKYGIVPYLNSSLFEISELEDLTIKINALDDNLDIPFYANSVLKKGISKKDTSVINTLHYFLDFLDAYDFSSVGKEEIQEENKTIINASVLGLVFEKINGYRDGSIYTPGVITMYMSHQTIRKSVLQKFNDIYNWKTESISDLKNHLADHRNAKDILEFNEVIDNLKICDPAVGSGHFLVSSLNELISIKAELGIFADENGNRLSDIDISIANDELVVNYTNQDFFEYLVSTQNDKISVSPQIQRIQKTLFNEKRKLIENCLFGVDINPNSVKICQLRLWIELLKNAYYKVDNNAPEIELETLPNIDINIKHGNSLLSKYSLTEDLSDVFKRNKYSVKDYKIAVKRYKEAPNKETKEQLKSFIKEIKSQFQETVSNRDPLIKDLSKFRGKKTLAETANLSLFGNKKSQKEIELEIQKYQKEIDKIEAKINEKESNIIYKNALEWRFEFPEILDNNGNYTGFDIIVGNPPYIRIQGITEQNSSLANEYKKRYKSATGSFDIYVLFVEKALDLGKENCIINYIMPVKWTNAAFGLGLRSILSKEKAISKIINFGSYQAFEASTYTGLQWFKKSSNEFSYSELNNDIKSNNELNTFLNSISKENITIINSQKLNKEPWTLTVGKSSHIIEKLNEMPRRLSDIFEKIFQGIATSKDDVYFLYDCCIDKNLVIGHSKYLEERISIEREFVKPLLKGDDVHRYEKISSNKFVIFPYDISSDTASLYSEEKIKINFPNAYNYLKRCETTLRDREKGRFNIDGQWFQYGRKQGINYANLEKLVAPEISLGGNFSYDINGEFYSTTKIYGYIKKKQIKESYHFWLGLLNSNIFWYYIKQTGYVLRGGYYTFKTNYVVPFPIPVSLDPELVFRVENLVKEILFNKENLLKTNILQTNIDEVIYQIYNLDKDEISIIENNCKDIKYS